MEFIQGMEGPEVEEFIREVKKKEYDENEGESTENEGEEDEE